MYKCVYYYYYYYYLMFILKDNLSRDFRYET